MGRQVRMILMWVLAALFVGCGADAGISRDEAEEIAAMSQDAEQYLGAFADAIEKLGGKEGCTVSAMREFGGFMKVTGDPLYFLYCGIPNKRSNR